MRPITGVSTLGAVLALAAMMVRGADEPAPARAVIIELFTSQGCSSCPPADRLLAKLGGPMRVAGRDVQVVPLAFHVDYWDDIGWPDPFASPAWTERQRRYAGWLGDDQIYTPQLVVLGGRHAVGSNRDKVEALIGWAATEDDRVALEAEATLEGDRLIVAIKARALRPLGDLRPAVMVAVFDGGHETAVERGENARRALRNEWVVRQLDEAILMRKPVIGTRWKIAVDPSWRRQALGVAVFVQDRRTGAILGAVAPPVVAVSAGEDAP